MKKATHMTTSDPEIIADTVYQRLRESILSAVYRPNHRLVETEIADELAVSRTPVREALVRLRHEGLVVQRKGWTVRDHEPAEIMELIEARASVEAAAAYLAARHLTADQLSGLQDLAARMEDPSLPRAKVNDLNNEFHDQITAGSGNALLVQFSRRTQINYWNFNQPVVFTQADDAQVNAQHRELLGALHRGDSEAAERVARLHVNLTARIIGSALGLSVDDGAS